MIWSLRLRLAAATFATILLGLGAAAALAPFELSAALPALYLREEPYQDFVLLVPLGILTTALIWLVSGWTLRDVRRASTCAASISPGDLETRIALRSLPTEIRPLVEAFNGTLDRLSAAYLSERRFISDAAHGLRTPLAVLSLRLQAARGGVVDWDAIEQDLDAVGRLATQLLDLARKDHLSRLRDRAERSPVDLARLTREVAATAVHLAQAAGRDLVVEAPARLAVTGRQEDLRDVIGNLVDNALIHGRGTITLRCGAAEDGAAAWLSVEDEGGGIPSGLEATVFDRFRKLDPDSPGHGLGLAIVRETVLGLDGTVRVGAGPGCRVQVDLPAPREQRDARCRPAEVAPPADAAGRGTPRAGP